jgi:glutamate-1-semialdehyde 2,1-aminomutase
VYQAGTLSGSPVAVAAGLATLRLIRQPGFFDALSARTTAFVEGMSAAAAKHGVAFSAQAVGAMFGLYFSPTLPQSFADVMASDRERFNRFFHLMLEAGHYLAPSAFEAGFVSAAHGEGDIAATLSAAGEAFRQL